jgi:hypothetical protein
VKRIVEAGGPQPELVLDPCLLNPPTGNLTPRSPPSGGRLEGRRRHHQNFVAVYGHGFPDWFASAARDWARARGQKLVSIGYRNAWADEQRIDADPECFCDLMSACAAVATDFFHGCVFAVLNQKPFACVATAYRETKLRDFCALLGIEARLAQDPSAVGAALSTPLAAEVFARVAALRAKSEAFLADALKS